MRHKTKSNVPSHLPTSESSGHEGRESYLRWRAHTCITASVHSLSLQRCRFWTWSKACGETSVCTRLCKGSLLLRRPCLCHLSFLHWAELYMPYMPSRTWFSDRIVVLHRGTTPDGIKKRYSTTCVWCIGCSQNTYEPNHNKNTTQQSHFNDRGAPPPKHALGNKKTLPANWWQRRSSLTCAY